MAAALVADEFVYLACVAATVVVETGRIVEFNVATEILVGLNVDIYCVRALADVSDELVVLLKLELLLDSKLMELGIPSVVNTVPP